MSLPDHLLDPDDCWWCERCGKACMGPTCDECTKDIEDLYADAKIQDAKEGK